MSCEVNRGVHVFDASDLFALIEEGSNMNITLNVVDNKVVFASTGTGGASNGIKYHLKATDSVTVEDCFEYFVACGLSLDSGATLTIESGGRVVVYNGIVVNDGVISNDGIIKLGL